VEEARRRGLHRNDLIIDRRLLQKLSWVLELEVVVPEPSDAVLDDWLAARPDSYQTSAIWTFEHRFFDKDRRDDAQGDAARRVGTGEPPAGDPWTRGHTSGATRSQIAGAFGDAVAAAVASDRQGQWLGPVASVYGWHLLWVTAHTPATMPSLQDIRGRVAEDWKRRQRNELVAQRLDEIAARKAPIRR
jgi:hypothetical protein